MKVIGTVRDWWFLQIDVLKAAHFRSLNDCLSSVLKKTDNKKKTEMKQNGLWRSSVSWLFLWRSHACARWACSAFVSSVPILADRCAIHYQFYPFSGRMLCVSSLVMPQFVIFFPFRKLIPIPIGLENRPTWLRYVTLTWIPLNRLSIYLRQTLNLRHIIIVKLLCHSIISIFANLHKLFFCIKFTVFETLRRRTHIEHKVYCSAENTVLYCLIRPLPVHIHTAVYCYAPILTPNMDFHISRTTFFY